MKGFFRKIEKREGQEAMFRILGGFNEGGVAETNPEPCLI